MNPRQQRAALIRLGLVVAAVIAVSIATGIGDTVLVVAAIVAMIVLHELGHFLTAKWAKMKVTEFFFGFGPRLWSIQRGETTYGVKLFPLGGYCRIIGMNNLDEVDPADEPRTYRQKGLWRRLSVAVAGSATHFLLAFVLLFAMFVGTGDMGNLVTPPANNPIVELAGLTSGPSPAQKAGFQLGDRIEAIDGHTFKTFDELSRYLRDHPGDRLNVTVDRRGHLLHLYPTLANLADVTPKGAPKAKTAKPTGFLGVGVSVNTRFGPLASVEHAATGWVSISRQTVDTLGHLVTLQGIHSYVHMLVSQRAADNPHNSVRFESPVGIVRLAHQASRDGLGEVLYLLILINIFVGIFNLLPFFPLDGGHVVLALYEGVRSVGGRRYHADAAKLLPIAYLAVLLIAFIGVSSLFLDLRQLIS